MTNERLAEKVANYTPDKQALASLRNGHIVILTAASGSGKNAVINRLLEKYPNDYRFWVSHTTRSPRMNDGVMEEDGVQYHFIDFKQAEKLLDSKKYVEANWYSGNIYGTTVDEILTTHKQGKIAISEIEVQGTDDFVERVPTTETIFIVPPNFDEWLRRLKKRYGDTHETHAEDLRRRIETAKAELDNVLHSKHFDIVVNDGLDDAVTEVNNIARTGQAELAKQEQARAIAEKLYEDIDAYLSRERQ